MSDTLGASVGINLINLFPLGNGVIGAFRLAHVTVDAFIYDQQRHRLVTWIRGSGPVSVPKAFVKPLIDLRVQKLRDVTSMPGNLLDHGRREKGIALRGC